MTKKIKGFTLIETLLIIGIVSLMVIGIYGAYAKKYETAIAKTQGD